MELTKFGRTTDSRPFTVIEILLSCGVIGPAAAGPVGTTLATVPAPPRGWPGIPRSRTSCPTLDNRGLGFCENGLYVRCLFRAAKRRMHHRRASPRKPEQATNGTVQKAPRRNLFPSPSGRSGRRTSGIMESGPRDQTSPGVLRRRLSGKTAPRDLADRLSRLPGIWKRTLANGSLRYPCAAELIDRI